MFLEALGEDPDREGLRDTPARVARAADEMFAGLLVDPADVLAVTFGADHDELVMVRDIPFYSTCEHHLVPFHGSAHVAYLPGADGRVTGLSKIARLVDACAKRPGLQEGLTAMIADTMEAALNPRGVLVVIEARPIA
jgi:GTP cyclohydrolase I